MPGKRTRTQRLGEDLERRASVQRARAAGEADRLAATAGTATEPVRPATIARVRAALAGLALPPASPDDDSPPDGS